MIAFSAPIVDYHALAPELVLAVGICVVLLVDLFVPDHKRWVTGTISGFVLLGALLPIVTLAVTGSDVRTALGGAGIDGRYVIDNFALVLKALFLLSGYVVVLLSSQQVEESTTHKGEYYVLLLSSVLGMVMMASSRDLVSVFVALEFLSIPAYMLAAWNKRDRKGNEAGVKYYLLGVFASAVMLYGMSLLYGLAGSTQLTEIGRVITLDGDRVGVQVLAIVFVIVGFAFKVSAVPFHTWAPDTYEGAPTAITAFLSVASKAAGFVGLLLMVFLAFPLAVDAFRPFLWVIAALTMTVGNLVALRQKNLVRMLAYSSVSQGGFILMPVAMAFTNGSEGASLRAVMVYLIIYAATNLGAFSIIIAVARRTGSAEISSYGGLFNYAPGLTVLMTIFLGSLTGIPPLGGWYAKFGAFRAALDAGGGWGYGIAIIAAMNSVIATAYYIKVMREMWMKPVPEGIATTSVKVPASLQASLALCGLATVAFGVVPGIIAKVGSITDLYGVIKP